MTELAFLSPARCVPEGIASPLARALEGVDTSVVGDLSHQGKVEIRGELGAIVVAVAEELIGLSPRRGFLLTDDAVASVERLRAQGLRAYDVTGALAGIAIDGERLLRRLTDLDLDALPAAGGFARVSAIVVRDEGERFRAYFAQELGHYVVEFVLDAIEGLENT